MAGESESQTNPRLLKAVRDLRDDRAWTAFRRRYEGLIHACCLKQGLRPEAADELTQSVLVKLVTAMPRFNYDRRQVSHLVAYPGQERGDRPAAPGRPPPGDYGSGDSTDQAALANLPDPSTIDPEAVAETLQEQLERDARVCDACDRVRNRIGDRAWQAFWLKTVDGLPVAEIARRLGMTVGAVYQAGTRVRSLIERELGELC